MRGTILQFDNETHTGLISGNDGNRYSFARVNWTVKKNPREGQTVDFEADGKKAMDIIVVTGASAGGSGKSRTVAALLCFFLGVIGVHRFYVGKIGTAILMIVTLGGLGIWTLIDFIVILCGAFRDADGDKITQW